MMADVGVAADEWFAGVCGKRRVQESLAAHCRFGTGGAADWVFWPQGMEDLQKFLRQKPRDVPVTAIGAGSNLLVRDGGVRGVTVILGENFAALEMRDDGVIYAEASVLDLHLARFAAEQSRTGLEFYAGIPGTVGGAVVMNAGADNSDTAAVLRDAELMLPDGTAMIVPNQDLGLSYRQSRLPEGAIVTAARFDTQAGDRDEIMQQIVRIQKRRRQTQPVGARTGGSTFKNPPDGKAWQLIADAGMRGFAIGDAQMSEKHCNFIINRGNASSADLEALGEAVRVRVKAESGIQLQWEIHRIGEPVPETKSDG